MTDEEREHVLKMGGCEVGRNPLVTCDICQGELAAFFVPREAPVFDRNWLCEKHALEAVQLILAQKIASL